MSGPLDLRLMERGRARRSGSSIEAWLCSEVFLGVTGNMVSEMLGIGVIGRASGEGGLIVSAILIMDVLIHVSYIPFCAFPFSRWQQKVLTCKTDKLCTPASGKFRRMVNSQTLIFGATDVER